uniref:RING-type domain-containing protein n=1 Tax=Megaselia scalaris TaxID=36166 RepID=T1GFM5_MEGSC
MECVICAEDLLTNGSVVTIPCGHIFHKTCLMKSLTYRSSCPLCRNRTFVTQLHTIYLNSILREIPAKICEEIREYKFEKRSPEIPEEYCFKTDTSIIKYIILFLGFFGIKNQSGLRFVWKF